MRCSGSFVRTIILSMAVLFVLSNLTYADTPTVWGDLKPGEYQVGFRTIEKYDNSRTLYRKFDYFGNETGRNLSRPIQVCIWYPAHDVGDATPMTYGEYAFPYPNDDSFFDVLGSLQNREIGYHYALTQNMDLGLTMMSAEMGAHHDAPEVEGTFPLVIYHSDLLGAYSENAVLCEYLASHGYIVATTHTLGMASISPDTSMAEIDNLTRDKEFIIPLIQDDPRINYDHIILVGQGAGALTALQMQMRNFSVEGVVCLNGWELRGDMQEMIKDCDCYMPDRMNVPCLTLYSASEGSEANLDIVESLNYSDRCLAGLYDVQNLSFLSYNMFSYMLTEDMQMLYEDSNTGYQNICRLTKAFIDKLTKPSEAEDFNAVLSKMSDDKILTFVTHEGSKPPPTVAQFFNIAQNVSIDSAVAIFERTREKEPDRVLFPENNMNVLGYRFLQGGQPEAAVKAFKMLAEAFPQSANSWDSLSDGYMAVGDRKNAIECMHKALELLPQDDQIPAEFKRQIRTKCEQSLKELEGQNQ